MTKAKSTKRAWLASVLSMILCCAMLIGSTFAWFTDEVKTGVNQIVAGNLDVELEYRDANGVWQKVKEDTKLFSNLESDGKTANLWEPGHTEAVYLKISNVGSLALKYQFAVNVVNETLFTNALGETNCKLSDYLVFGQAASKEEIAKYANREAAWDAAGKTMGLKNYTKSNELLEAGASEYVALIVYMPTTVRNEANYRGDVVPEIELGINLVATQAKLEKDSFSNDYDETATYPLPTIPAVTETALTLKGDVYEYNNSYVKASVPSAATTSEQTPKLTVKPTTVPAGAQTTISADGQEAISYDITITNVALSDSHKATVDLYVGKGLKNVKLYHHSDLVTDAVYNSETGYICFTTSGFSPFTVSFDKYVASIDGERYYTFESAVNAAKADSIIYIWNHVTLSSDIVTKAQLAVAAGSDVTLDLAGHTLESQYAGISIVNNGTLTVTGDGLVHNTSAEVGDNYAHDAIRNFGTLTIESGTFGDSDRDTTNANTEHRGAALRNMSGATCTIKDGSFTCGDNYYTWGNTTGYSYAIRNAGSLVIENANLYGAMNGGIASEGKNGETVINGGTFAVTGSRSYYVLVTNKPSTITVNNGKFVKENGNGGLIGGFSGMPSWDAADDLANNGYVINGGTFVLNGETVNFQ